MTSLHNSQPPELSADSGKIIIMHKIHCETVRLLLLRRRWLAGSLVVPWKWELKRATIKVPSYIR